MAMATLISNLSQQQTFWTINVLLIEKSKINSFKSGNGKILKMTLMDTEGCKIHAIMFNEIIDKFNDMLNINKTYVISNGQVRNINKEYSNVNDKFEIILNHLTEIHEAEDYKISLQLSFSTLEDIKSNPKLPADIILLVVKVYEIRSIYRHKDNKKVVKRDLQVLGLRSELAVLTLWETLATDEGLQLERSKDQHPVILAKSIVGGYFNGFTLSTTSTTIIIINPDLPEVHQIKQWYFENRFTIMNATTKDNSITNLLQINTSTYSSGEIKYYNTKVTIKGIKEEGNIWYNACNTCKSKVIVNENSFQCIKCKKSDAEYTLRYLVKLHVEDITSTAIFTLFDTEAEYIIGVPVAKLFELKDSNFEEYEKILSNFLGCIFTSSVKVQDKIYGNQTVRTITVQSIKDKFDEAEDQISKMLKKE